MRCAAVGGLVARERHPAVAVGVHVDGAVREGPQLDRVQPVVLTCAHNQLRVVVRHRRGRKRKRFHRPAVVRACFCRRVRWHVGACWSHAHSNTAGTVEKVKPVQAERRGVAPGCDKEEEVGERENERTREVGGDEGTTPMCAVYPVQCTVLSNTYAGVDSAAESPLSAPASAPAAAALAGGGP